MKKEKMELTEKQKQMIRENFEIVEERPFGSLRRSPSKKHILYDLWKEQNGKK